MSYEKIVLVTRKTRLEELVERFNTKAQARFYIEHSGGNFELYEREHETYYSALATLRQELQGMSKLHVIERSFLPNFLFADNDLVVTIGIDGLVVNTAKYLSGQPLVAINPDPQHIDGVLLPFTVEQAQAVIHLALRGRMEVRPITMAEVRLNDGQRLLAFNDFFIGRHDHVSARYVIRHHGREERHSSSGIIVSTGAGATGWLSSVFNMANGMIAHFGKDEARLVRPELAWDTDSLFFVVREPFVSKTSGAAIVCGPITQDAPLVLESTMAEGGVIFSDGVAADYIAFNAGATATIGLAQQKTQLVVKVG
jgi:NAD kinase